jgi:hypothetical protein
MSVYPTALKAMLATLFLIGTLSAAESTISGKVKAIHADKREFILTDAAGKDQTIKLSDSVVINRGGKESQSDLKDGDVVCIYYEKNVLTWLATYILVQEGDSKNWTLAHGNVKNYDAEKKELTYTDDQGKDATYSMVGVKVYVNKAESKVESLKIGEHILGILQKAGDRTSLKSLIVDRK